MSGFNWDAFGPVGDDPGSDADAAGQGAPASASDGGGSPVQPPRDWDFLFRDDPGMTTEAMTGQLEEFLEAAKDAQSAAAAVTANAWDRDHLVHVTVNSVGVVIATEFATDALRRSSSTSLAAAVTEAAQTAASAAQTAVEKQLSPLIPGLNQLDEAVPAPPGTPDVNQLFEDARDAQRRLYHEPRDPGIDQNPGPRPNTDERTRP